MVVRIPCSQDSLWRENRQLRWEVGFVVHEIQSLELQSAASGRYTPGRKKLPRGSGKIQSFVWRRALPAVNSRDKQAEI